MFSVVSFLSISKCVWEDKNTIQLLMKTMFLSLVLFTSIPLSSKWLCNQIEIQYQIIHEKISRIQSDDVLDLKTIVADYWEENHKHCFSK